MGSCFSSEKSNQPEQPQAFRANGGQGNNGSDGTANTKVEMDQIPAAESRKPSVNKSNTMVRDSSGDDASKEARQKSVASSANGSGVVANGKPSPNGGANGGPAVSLQSDSLSAPQKDEVKILLLGSGESGKSTILKQMKIIHQNGYSQEELLMYKTTVYKNLLDCAKAIVGALDKFGLRLDTPSAKTAVAITSDDVVVPDDESSAVAAGSTTSSDEHVNGISPVATNGAESHVVPVSMADLDVITNSIISPDPDTVLDPNLVNIIGLLWAHPIVKSVLLERRSEFYIMDSAPYFFNNVKRIGDSDYIPTENDILRARIKTTGIYETRFEMGGLNIHMYDVGGQRSERKKWIHCFDNVTLIIFCVGLSEYDQVLLEETNQNRMAESLVLFKSVINSRWFKRTSVVLFLNKIDVFTEKLPHSPLENYFEDYTGGNDINKAAKYILWRFTQANQVGLNIYPHLTQATDTSNIRLVFAAVKETILQNSLRDSGIL
jgi:guanine nucleotide-binding protein G(i) subunit alpha